MNVLTRLSKLGMVLWALGATLGASGQTSPERAALHASQSCAAYKGRALSLLVPFRAGGGFDLEARALKPFLERHTGMEVSVVNMAGAGGMLAARAVSDGHSVRVVAGLFDPRTIGVARLEGHHGPSLAEFAVVGSTGTTRAVWVTPVGLNLENVSARKLTASSGNEALIRQTLVGQALGIDLLPLRGLQSSNEAWAALLRKDVDLVTSGSDSAERWMKTSAAATVSLVLGSAPDPHFPTAPYLAGPGGLAEKLAAKEPALVKERRMTLAALAASLADTSRMVLVSTRTSSSIRQCLEASIEATLVDPAYLASPYARESNSERLALDRAKRRLEEIRRSLETHAAMLQELAQRSAKSD